MRRARKTSFRNIFHEFSEAQEKVWEKSIWKIVQATSTPMMQ